MTGLWVPLGAVAAAAVVGLVWRRREGRIRTAPGTADPARLDPALLDRLGVRLGERATLVQFSSAFCQPCRATRGVLAHVSGTTPGVTHVEVDAESQLEAVRALGILRTPTTLVLDAAGREVARAGGVPKAADVVAALAAVRPAS